MATASEPPRSIEDSLRAHVALQEWVTEHGGHLDERVRFSRDEQRGVHIQAKPEQPSDLPRRTCVLKAPVALTMSYFDAIDYRPPTEGVQPTSPFSSRGVRLPGEFVDAVGPEETTAFFLMGQYLKGQDGFWFPYIRSLPRPDELTTPLYYDGEDLAWLNFTSLAAARERRMQLWRANYEKGLEILEKLRFENANHFTWDLYLWASTIISSRAFTAKVLASVIPMTELREDKISVLLPLIDATNHRPLAKVEWQAGTESIGLVVMDNVPPGVEIANNYGPRNNEQLMMNYGFCIPDNPCDYRVVSLRTPPGSPLSEIKMHHEQQFPQSRKRDQEEDKYYVFSIAHPLLSSNQPLELSIFSPDLLRAISVIAANDRELETLKMDQDGFRIPLEPYGNSRNLIASLNQISIELISYIQKLEFSARQLGSPRNLKQLYAKQFRESQIQLSRTACLCAHWTISLSRATGAEEAFVDANGKERHVESLLSRIPPGTLSGGTADQIRSRILNRASLLPPHKHGEVFQFTGLFRLLPTQMQKSCENCLRGIMSEAEQAIVIGEDGPPDTGRAEERNGPHSLLAFGTYICFIVAVYRRDNESLSPRLGKWCRFLLDTYTPPPTDVAWALPDEDDEAILSAFDQLIDGHLSDDLLSDVSPFVGRQPGHGQRTEEDWWLSPNWLRWAWLVLEQETIMNMVDDPLEYIVTTPEASVPGAGIRTKNFLYIPREDLTYVPEDIH